MTRVIVHVDRLVLRGFAPAERRALAAGLQDELARLLADPQVVQRTVARGTLPRLDLGTVARPPGGSVADIGRITARRIVGGERS